MSLTARTPEVSVILPACNAALTLGETLASLSAQTMTAWEAIIVDDGSTDRTADQAAAFAANDPRFHLIRQTNGGVSAARNTGITAARADWLVFLDADDWIAPDHLERLTRERHIQPQPDLIHCDSARVMPDGRHGRPDLGPRHADPFATAARHCPFTIHACLVRKATVVEAGSFDTGLVACEDWDLWQRIARTGARFRAVPAVLAFYRQRPGSASTAVERFLTDGLEVIRRIHRPDPRVTAPLPEYANGASPQQEPETLYHFTTWIAAYAIGQGRDAAPMLEGLAGYRHPNLSPHNVAWILCDAVPIGSAKIMDDWRAAWPELEPRIHRFLEALEKASGAPDLAIRARRQIEALILDTVPLNRPATLGMTRQIGIDPTRAMADVDVPPGIDRLRCVVTRAGGRIGTIELPVLGTTVPGTALAQALHQEIRELARSGLRGRHWRNWVGLLTWLFSPGRLCRAGKWFALWFCHGNRAQTSLHKALLEALLAHGGAIAALPPGPTARTTLERRAALEAELCARLAPRTPKPSAELFPPNPAAYWEHVFTEPDPWGYTSDYEQIKYRQTLELLPDGPVAKALELACAEGHFTGQLAPRVRHLTAADISQRALDRARARCAGMDNITFRRIDLIKDPLPDRYDLIICSEVLYYVKDEASLRRIARKLAHALLPGGRLIMAHAHLSADDPHRTGFGWPHPFGGKRIGDIFTAIPSLYLRREIRTPLYRVQLFHRATEPQMSPPPPEIREVPLVVRLPPAVARQVRWRHPDPVSERLGSVDRLPILMYHRIAADGPPELKRYRTTPEAFDRQLTLLRREGFHAITLDEWRWHLLTRTSLPGRPVLITFDDGYRDVLTDAWPILRRHGMTATVFVVADAVGTVTAWDAGYGDPAALLSWNEIRALRDHGVSFGAHGASHRRLTGLRAEELVNEGIRSRVMLESCLEERVATLAYPYGDQDGAVRTAMRDCGFDVGFSIVQGIADIWANPLRVPRLEVTGFDTLDAFTTKLGMVPTTCSRQAHPALVAR